MKATPPRALPPLLVVSAGLDRAGGGAALLGRLVAGAAAQICAAEGRRLEILHLGTETPSFGPEAGSGPTPSVIAFRGNRMALAWAVWQRLLQHPPAAILFDHLGPARVMATVPARWRRPYLIFLLGIEVWRPLGRQRRRALRHASRLLAISQHTRERAQPFLAPALEGEDPPCLAVLPLTLPTTQETTNEATRETRLPEGKGGDEDEGYFLMVGRMSSSEGYKGHREVLAALPRVLARHPEARLVIAGGGDDRSRLEALARDRGLDGAVRFTGFVSEATLGGLYRHCLALVLPSRGEGFGLVFLEAMRAGKPVVAAQGSAAEEIVVDGETGLLVDADSPESIAGALCHLLENPESRRRMGAAGRERWRRDFSPELFRQRLADHVHRLIRSEAGDQPAPAAAGLG